MTENQGQQADIARIEKLKELAGLGMIDGPASYFNHLIDVYGDLGGTNAKRAITDRERERIDMFLEYCAK